MPMKGIPVCLKCETNESPMWTNAENLGAICLNCVNETKDNTKTEAEEETNETKDDTSKPNRRKTRTTRSYKTRLNPFALPKNAIPKGRGRRSLLKKTPMKAPDAVSTTVTSDYVFYQVCGNTVFIQFALRTGVYLGRTDLLYFHYSYTSSRFRFYAEFGSPELLVD